MLINLKDVPVNNGTFEEIPSGRYNVRVEKSELTTAKSSGSDMIKLQYKITEGPYSKRSFFDQCVLTDKTLWRIKTMLAAIGSSLAESNGLEAQTIVDAFKNRELSLHVEVSKTTQGINYQCSNYKPLEAGHTSAPKEGFTPKTQQPSFGV